MESLDPVGMRRLNSASCTWIDVTRQPLDPERRRDRKDKLRVGLLVPFSGNDAIWGPAGQYSAILAAAQVNARGGVLGREIELFAADSGGPPSQVVPRIAELLDTHQVEALAGVHMSNVRIAIRNSFSRQVPYVYATQYEGGETARGLFPIGETPVEQYRGAIEWMIRKCAARRWYLLGNDYVWPRETHDVVRKLVNSAGGEVVGIDYLPLGGKHHRTMIKKIRDARPHILFQTLVGSDCVTFNQIFAAQGLPKSIARISGVIEENVLMGIGSECSENLYGISGYFNSLATSENKEFLRQYHAAFGTNAPVQGGMSQPCYESIIFLASLADRVGSLDVDDMAALSRDFSYYGARGRVKISADRTIMDCHLMQSSGIEYDLVRSFSLQ